MTLEENKEKSQEEQGRGGAKKTWKNYNTLNKVIRIHVTEEDYLELNKSALEAGLKISVYCRNRLFSRQVVIKKVDHTNEKLVFELHKIGTNINQMAHVLNREGAGIYGEISSTLEKILKELKEKINLVTIE